MERLLAIQLEEQETQVRRPGPTPSWEGAPPPSGHFKVLSDTSPLPFKGPKP